MAVENKPRMRSLLYLHMDDTTNGNRAPLAKPTVRYSRGLTVVLGLLVLYIVGSFILTSLGI